jgi:hypothetical protein
VAAVDTVASVVAALAVFTVALLPEASMALAPAPLLWEPTVAASMALARARLLWDPTVTASTVLDPARSFEDFMATTTGATATATGRMTMGTTMRTIRITTTTTPTTTTAVATLFSDGCTLGMVGANNPARYAVDRPSRIAGDRGLKRQLAA